MKQNVHWRSKLSGKILPMGWRTVALYCISAALFGCVVPKFPRIKPHNEAARTPVPEILESKYPYIEFNQQFPETYLFKERRDELWSTILKLLQERKETIVSMNKRKGEIITQTRALRAGMDRMGKYRGGKRLLCEQKILVKSERPRETYVTNRAFFFKVDKDGANKTEIAYPNPQNIMRGIFFGTLASAFYGEKGTRSKRKLEEKPVVIHEAVGEVVHIVKSGETFGEIAARYTRSAQNYKKIADYNSISNPNALKAGQKIRIPKSLQRDK